MGAVVVTGGTGLLGRVVVERLAGSVDLVALHRPGGATPEIEHVEWVACDLTKPLAGQLPREVDAVLHLAQSRNHRRFPESVPEVFEVNAGATVRLLDLCRTRGGAHFVQASSGAVYRPGASLLHEGDVAEPPSFYGHTKLAAEHAALSFDVFFAVTVLRFFFVYGRRQDPEAFIPGVLHRIRQGDAVRLAGDRGFRCNPIHVDEAAQAVIVALEQGVRGTYNIAGPEIVDLRQIAEVLAEVAAETQPRFEHVAAGGDLTADIRAMAQDLLTPTIDLREGLMREFGP